MRDGLLTWLVFILLAGSSVGALIKEPTHGFYRWLGLLTAWCLGSKRQCLKSKSSKKQEAKATDSLTGEVPNWHLMFLLHPIC